MKKRKIDFQDGRHCGLGFLIGTSSFLSTSHPDASYQVFGVNWPFGSGEEVKNRFSRWWPSWISDPNDFSYFDLLVTLMLPVKFQDNWPLFQEKK